MVDEFAIFFKIEERQKFYTEFKNDFKFCEESAKIMCLKNVLRIK